MQRFSQFVCLRCSLLRSQQAFSTRFFASAQPQSRRDRTGKSEAAWKPARSQGPNFPPTHRGRPPLRPRFQAKAVKDIPLPKVTSFFEKEVKYWSTAPRVLQRLQTFGVPQTDINLLLNQFVNEVRDGRLSTPENHKKYNLERFADSFTPENRLHHLDRIFTSIFYQWVSSPDSMSSLSNFVSKETLVSMKQLFQASDLSYPAEWFPLARAMRRKIIMHVGPTNSGKTYNALCALAGADVGVYAGPLRLLAHEVWQRLNSGQIVPTNIESPVELADDLGPSAPITGVKPPYVRACNLLTGEERKTVAENAPLLSCTVEMVPTGVRYDVAVIDEIQMIADPDRGGGWTNAVLGLCAQELHLCGEASAIPIIEAMVRDTGDDLIVKHYERLTPLIVQDTSLHGDLSSVQKGDCLVTFARRNIFNLKGKVEEATGLRCAVAYGRLPPEIRSEQAALFNNPDSEFDVMIGSDAIGMGLNLKIKRIILETTRKFDGTSERPLKTSQIKQIAGRAGRFGMHEDNSLNGLVTTLHERDLPILRQAIAAPPEDLSYARIMTSYEQLSRISRALPAGSSTGAIYEAQAFLARLPPIYRLAEVQELDARTTFIDKRAANLSLAERCMLMQSPIPWRDDTFVDLVKRFVSMYGNSMSVNLHKAFFKTEYIDTVERLERLMIREQPPVESPETLVVLETLHKILVFYLWMSFRNSVAYAEQAEASELKGRVEKVLEWCLQGMSGEQYEENAFSRRGYRKPSGLKGMSRRQHVDKAFLGGGLRPSGSPGSAAERYGDQASLRGGYRKPSSLKRLSDGNATQRREAEADKVISAIYQQQMRRASRHISSPP